MIDEKKIKKAMSSYATETFNHIEERFAAMCGFKEGAEWAQKEFVKSLWHDASEEPDAKLHAWLIMQTGKDLYETVKYGGYNEDGGQTWQQQAKKGNILRWVYLDDLLPKEGGVG